MASRVSSPARRTLLAVVLLALVAPARAENQVLPFTGKVPDQQGGGPYLFKFVILDGQGNTLWSNDATSINGSEPRTPLQLYVSDGSFSIDLGLSGLANMTLIPPAVLKRQDLRVRVWYAAAYAGRFERLPDKKIGGQGFALVSERAFDADKLQGKTPADFEPAGAVAAHEAKYLHRPVGEDAPSPPATYSQVYSLTPLSSVKMRVLVPRNGAALRLTLYGEPSDRVLGIDALELQRGKVQDQPVGSTRTVVDRQGPGWLAGVRESYDFCNSCFKRRRVPATTVLVDGQPFDAWRAGHLTPSDTQDLGHIENFVPLGLIRFDRSLKVTSRQDGIDGALGNTVVWYYTARSSRRAPAALSVVLDGSDVTGALVAAASALPGAVGPLVGALDARRLDGVTWPANKPATGEELESKPAAAFWLERGFEGDLDPGAAGASVYLSGEVHLVKGKSRFALRGDGQGFVELRQGGRFNRVLQSGATGGLAEAEVEVASEGWYGLRVGVNGSGEHLGWRLDLPKEVKIETDVRTAPTLGAGGSEAWKLGPVDLGELVPIRAGEHSLSLREGAGNGGDLQVIVEVD